MNQGHKTWMAAVAFALCANAAGAAQMPDDNASVGGPDASVLMAFYEVSLGTSPVGVAEDKAVWMAKVQGLIAQAPAWLQQNVLASKSKAEFAANMAILESMQKATLESSAMAVKSAAARNSVKLQKAAVGSSAAVVKGGDASNSPIGPGDPAKGPVVGPNNLGSGNSDVVFTPLSPCRILDTRNASGASGVQGPLAGNTLYQIPGFITAGTNWSQFGQLAPLSDCGLNNTVGTNIRAVAIVITILNPNFDAFLGVSDSSVLSTVLSKVALNYTHGQGLSTMYIVPQIAANIIYFAMPAGLSAQLIFDVVGFFEVSQATALDCFQTAQTIVNVANGALIQFNVAAACPATYTETNLNCHAATLFGGTSWTGFGQASTFQNGDCQGVNNSGSAQNYIGTRTCCRVPGR